MGAISFGTREKGCRFRKNTLSDGVSKLKIGISEVVRPLEINSCVFQTFQ
jgi:hypothetical protein